MARIKGAAAFDIFEFREAIPDSPAFADVPALPEKPRMLDNLNRPVEIGEAGEIPEHLTEPREKLFWLICNTPGGISYPQAAQIIGCKEEDFRITPLNTQIGMDIRDTGNRYRDPVTGWLRVVWAGPLQGDPDYQRRHYGISSEAA